MNEHQLYKKMKAGYSSAFDELFRLYYEKLVRLAHQKTQDLAVAEDIVQAIFIDFWTKRAEISINQSIIAYLSKMVNNRCIDYFRKQKSISASEEKYLTHKLNLDVTSPEEDLLNQENLAAIYSKIEELPPKCKIVFKMSRFEDLTYEEISTQLNVSQKTVEYHISTALRLLRKSIFGLVLVLISSG